jgi:maltose O-acetyltransferase
MGIEDRINQEFPKRTLKKPINNNFHRIITHFRKKLVNAIPDFDFGYKIKNNLLNFGFIGKDCVIRNGIQYRHGPNIYLGDNVFINYNCVLLDSESILIAGNVSLGPGVHIYTIDHKMNQDGKLSSSKSPVYIGKNVWIGGNSTILPGVSIGENSIIGAGSVVTCDVETNSLYAGVPARKIKSRV